MLLISVLALGVVGGVLVPPSHAVEVAASTFVPVDDRPVEIGRELPQFRFGAIRDSAGNIAQIEVYVAGTAKAAQVLIGAGPDDAFGRDLELGDMNFDGYRDLRLAVSYTSWKVWLFNPRSRRFVFDSPLSLASPKFVDAARRELVEVGSGGDGGAVRGVTRYRFVKGRLTVVRSFAQVAGPESGTYHREVRERRGNKLVVTQRCLLRVQDLEREASDAIMDPACPKQR